MKTETKSWHELVEKCGLELLSELERSDSVNEDNNLEKIKERLHVERERIAALWNDGDEYDSYLAEKITESLDRVFGKDDGGHDVLKRLAQIFASQNCAKCGHKLGQERKCIEGAGCPVFALAIVAGAVDEIKSQKTQEDEKSYARFFCETLGKVFHKKQDEIERLIANGISVG